MALLPIRENSFARSTEDVWFCDEEGRLSFHRHIAHMPGLSGEV